MTVKNLSSYRHYGLCDRTDCSYKDITKPLDHHIEQSVDRPANRNDLVL